MATTTASKHFSRLHSHESLTKVTTGRKLRSKKVIIANKSSQKINVGARSRKLRTSTNNNQTPIRNRLRPRQNRKNYCEDTRLLRQHLPSTQQDSVVVLEKLDVKDKKLPVYKTMKSEKSSEDKSDIYDFKFDINDTEEKISKKKGKKRNVNKGNKVNKGKGKITKKTAHKKLETIDNEVNKSPKHDINLPAGIKQSGPPSESVIELIGTRSKKDIAKKIEIPKICIDADTEIAEVSVKEDIVKKIDPKPNTDIQMVKESTKEDIIKKIEIPETNVNIQAKGEINLSDKTFAEQMKKQDPRKLRIVSIENANNILVTTSSPNNTENIQPFRSKNILDNKTTVKYKNTLNCSLLTKSLSPISKTTNTLDLGSPCRLPTSSLFSQAKHFFQSTPNMSFKINNEDLEMNKENVDMNKENVKINKENKHRADKERKKKILHKKRMILHKGVWKLQTNQASKEVQVTTASKPALAPAPSRMLPGEIKNLLQEKQDINVDNGQTADQVHVKVDKPFVEQRDKYRVDYHNFSDTFDMLSETETERQSNVENDNLLFMDLEPSHFSQPAKHSYRRKRTVKFDFSEVSEEEEEKENVKPQRKKKKLTKSEKEYEKRVSEWAKSVNSTFQEVEEYNLIIE